MRDARDYTSAVVGWGRDIVLASHFPYIQVRQVVFVLSTNYAGSHLLSQLLGAHSMCRSVGELHNLRKYSLRRNRSDDVESEFGVHPAFDGLVRLPVSAWHSRIFDNLQTDEPRVWTLIDNSKRTVWAVQFVGHREFESQYIHLVRDPRALVRRWLVTYRSGAARRRQRIRLMREAPRFTGVALMGEDADVYRYKWLTSNRRITRFLQRLPARTSIVTYRDLVLETRSTLESLMTRLRLEFEPAQLGYGNAFMTGTRKRRYTSFARESLIELDTRWQHDLSPVQIRAIEDDSAIRRYLGALQIEMTETGLTKRGAAR